MMHSPSVISFLSSRLSLILILGFMVSGMQSVRADGFLVVTQQEMEVVQEPVQDHDADAQAQEGHADDHGPLPPLWLIIPFAVILTMIATGPLFFAHHWHQNYPR